MDYHAGAAIGQGTAVKTSSLTADAERNNLRLQDLCGRISKIADTLHGSVPRDIGVDAKSTIEPPPTIRRSFDRCLTILNDIEGEVTRIESQL